MKFPGLCTMLGLSFLIPGAYAAAPSAITSSPAAPLRVSSAMAPLPAPAVKLVSFDEAESARRLARAEHKAAFFALANHFESQINKFFCGPASATIALNALRAQTSPVKKPQDPAGFDPASQGTLPKGYDPLFEKYTQNTFFNAKTDAIKTKAQVFGKVDAPDGKPDYGLTLDQLAGMLRAHGLTAQVHHADPAVSDKDLIRDLNGALDSNRRFALVNFNRPALGQAGGGHISPIGAYDAKSDSFLLLDVNPNASPWVWVPRADLIKAMRTLDGAAYRGYVIVAEGG